MKKLTTIFLAGLLFLSTPAFSAANLTIAPTLTAIDLVRSTIMAPFMVTDITSNEGNAYRKQLMAVRDDAVKFLADGEMSPILQDSIIAVQELDDYRYISEKQAAAYIILAAESE